MKNFVIGVVVTGVAVGTYPLRASQSEQSVPQTNMCENCQGTLTDASGDGDNPHVSTACPHCENKNTGQA